MGSSKDDHLFLHCSLSLFWCGNSGQKAGVCFSSGLGQNSTIFNLMGGISISILGVLVEAQLNTFKEEI